MKKQVAEFIKSIGGASSYSGKTKTLYIRASKKFKHRIVAPKISDLHMKVIEKFGFGLPFRLA